MNEKPFLKSKKFWAAIIVVVGALLKQFAGIDLPTEAFGGVIAYIVGQGIADAGKNKKPVELLAIEGKLEKRDE